MNRRSIALSALLTIALVLIFRLGTPGSVAAGANLTAVSFDTGSGIVTNTLAVAVLSPTGASVLLPPSIDTTPYWNGSQFISSFGMTNTATYGQTISVTESAELKQFSFYMQAKTTTIFRGFVYEWDGVKATGTPLFESAPLSTIQSTQYEEVTFYIPAGVALKAGHQYVLFASTSKDPGQPIDAGKWGSVSDSAYSGGQFVYTNNYTDTTMWTGAAWSTITEDLVFKALLVKPASIDTTPDWNRIQFISSFGMPNTATYGQTISMTESAELTQFSFYMNVTSTTIFRGYVFEWDGLKATGAPLFESAPKNTTGAYFQEVVFNVPESVALEAGHQYILFASTSRDPVQPSSAGKWGAIITNTVYPGGQFFFLNNGADPSQWTTVSWSTISWDLAFKATLHYQTFLPVIIRQ